MSFTTDTIDAAFSHFVDDMLDVLSEENFDRVQTKCLQNLNIIGGISLPIEVEDKIDNSKNVSGLCRVLCRCRSHWNWMNIRMLEKLAGNSLEAKQLIENYKNKVFSRKIKDVMSDISNLEMPTAGYTKVKEKWNKDFNDLTVTDIVERWDDIEKKLNVKQTMLLESINEGCVEICWLLPDHLIQDAITLATSSQHQLSTGTQEELFPEMLYLEIGDAVIKDDIISKLCLKYNVKCVIKNTFKGSFSMQSEPVVFF